MEYKVRLSQFEGPLDLLLHLIGNAKIRIEDIFVSAVTEQYLQYMEELDEVDMDAASEFAQMAATLIYIKSRSLLPKREPAAEEDPEQTLIAQLREYGAVKAAGEALRVLEEQGRLRFFKLRDEYPVSAAPVDLSGVTLERLCEVFSELMSRMPEEEREDRQLNIRPETYSTHQKMDFIRQALVGKKRVRFTELFTGLRSRLEVAVTFLAMLELMAAGEIRARQSERFGEIYIVGGVSGKVPD